MAERIVTKDEPKAEEKPTESLADRIKELEDRVTLIENLPLLEAHIRTARNAT